MLLLSRIAVQSLACLLWFSAARPQGIHITTGEAAMLERIKPAFDVSRLGDNDWRPLTERITGTKSASESAHEFGRTRLFFYNQSVYPDELLVHVHIPKTGICKCTIIYAFDQFDEWSLIAIGGTTLFKLFSSRNCGFSTYKLKYRSYRILRRIERDRRESDRRLSVSNCGFFSMEFPSYNDAKLFLTPPIEVFVESSSIALYRSGALDGDPKSGTGWRWHSRLRDMTLLRAPQAHVLSGIYRV